MKKLMILLTAALFALAAMAQTPSNNASGTTSGPVAEKNPLLKSFDTPFGVPPFDQIKDEHYLPAFREGMRRHKEEIQAILTNGDEPTFANTIEALELSGSTLTTVSNIFYAVHGAHSNDQLREVAKEIAPELSAHYNEITMNKALFNRIQSVYKERNKLKLNPEQMQLLEETHKNFERSGVNLSEEKQQELKAIQAELSKLSQEFGDNLLKETNNFEVVADSREDLGNLPETLVAAAAQEAEKRGYEGKWVFTLHRPSINPFLQYSPNRELRKKLFLGYAMRGNNNNEHDNKKVLAKIAELRIQRAKIMGYDNHAEYVLANNMAETPERVMNLLDKVWKPAIETAKKEAADLEEMMHKEGIEGELKGWDWRYYTEKVRKARYDLDENDLRPYFEVNAVRDGVFQVCQKLFGLQFIELKDIPKWHPDQQVFEVREADGTHVGVVYLDLFARESKRGGAWMNELRSQSKVRGEVHPVVTTNFNFPAPAGDTPSLISHSNAETFFHEFGHAVHGLLSNVHYESLSGTNVPRDFVEFPSQVFENWMNEPEVLKMFAKHYKTGEPIPDSLIKKMQNAALFDQGFATAEYMAAAYLDMAWHTLEEPTKQDVESFEDAAMKKIGLIEQIIPRYRSTYLAHAFSGGYSAGYYSYLWSQVLDADCFEAFKETSLFDKETAKKYRKLLSMGGSRPGMELYKDFRGREPKIEALLKRRGFDK